jgi:hypothetical protein
MKSVPLHPNPYSKRARIRMKEDRRTNKQFSSTSQQPLNKPWI